MPLALIQPLEFKKTASTRDVSDANIFFPYGPDCGIDIKDICIFLVYNGFDHYCSVKLPGKTFKDGCKELYNLLSKARAISDTLGQCVESKVVKDVLAKVSEKSISSVYSIEQLMQNFHLVQLDDESSAKKRKLDEKEEKKRKTKSGKTSFTQFTCWCGVPKNDKEELDDHKKGGTHSNGNVSLKTLNTLPKKGKV